MRDNTRLYLQAELRCLDLCLRRIDREIEKSKKDLKRAGEDREACLGALRDIKEDLQTDQFESSTIAYLRDQIPIVERGIKRAEKNIEYYAKLLAEELQKKEDLLRKIESFNIDLQ